MEEIRYRLLIEQLQQWLERLGGKEQPEPDAIKELTVRLLAMALILLRQHSVNKRGQCQYCGYSRWYWRLLIKRPQCTVGSALGFAMEQELAVVRWWATAGMGRQTSLEEARKRQQRQGPLDSQ